MMLDFVNYEKPINTTACNEPYELEEMAHCFGSWSEKDISEIKQFHRLKWSKQDKRFFLGELEYVPDPGLPDSSFKQRSHNYFSIQNILSKLPEFAVYDKIDKYAKLFLSDIKDLFVYSEKEYDKDEKTLYMLSLITINLLSPDLSNTLTSSMKQINNQLNTILTLYDDKLSSYRKLLNNLTSFQRVLEKINNYCLMDNRKVESGRIFIVRASLEAFNAKIKTYIDHISKLRYMPLNSSSHLQLNRLVIGQTMLNQANPTGMGDQAEQANHLMNDNMMIDLIMQENPSECARKSSNEPYTLEEMAFYFGSWGEKVISEISQFHSLKWDKKDKRFFLECREFVPLNKQSCNNFSIQNDPSELPEFAVYKKIDKYVKLFLSDIKNVSAYSSKEYYEKTLTSCTEITINLISPYLSSSFISSMKKINNRLHTIFATYDDNLSLYRQLLSNSTSFQSVLEKIYNYCLLDNGREAESVKIFDVRTSLQEFNAKIKECIAQNSYLRDMALNSAKDLQKNSLIISQIMSNQANPQGMAGSS